MPCSSPRGISSVLPWRKPTTSEATGSRWRPALIRHSSPTSALRPVASMIRPIRSLTRPLWRARLALRSVARTPARLVSPWRSTSVELIAAPSRVLHCAPELAHRNLARALELCLDAGVKLAFARAHDCAAAPDPPLGVQLAVIDSPRCRGELRERAAHQWQVVGVHEDRQRAALLNLAQGGSHHVEHPLRRNLKRAGEDLLGQRQRELDRLTGQVRFAPLSGAKQLDASLI